MWPTCGTRRPQCWRRWVSGPRPISCWRLRRGARVWPPLSAALRDAAPAEVDVDDEALDELAEDSTALDGAGIEVLWPAELFAGELAVARDGRRRRRRVR